MSTNADAMVRAGVDAYRAGNKAEARTLLERAIEIDGYNETAWLWLSAVVDSPEEQQTCLENVLVINPENSRAIQGLKSLGIDPDTIINPPADSTAQAEASDEYAVPSSSASVEHNTPQATPDEYDDWVGGLNLGSSENQEPVAEASSVSEDLFGDIDFSDAGGSFDLDDELFNDNDYTGYADDVDNPDDEVIYEDAATDYVDDALFDEAVFDDGDDMFADISTLENFTDAVGDIADYDDSQFAADPFAPPPPKPMPKVAPEPADLFARIPAEIEVTRAPGVSESPSSIHYILIGILVLLNIGALGLIGFAFIS